MEMYQLEKVPASCMDVLATVFFLKTEELISALFPLKPSGLLLEVVVFSKIYSKF
jgi:hypothetical protein